MQLHKDKLDLPSFDFLFERFIKPDWGKKVLRNPLDVSKKITDFIKLLSEL